MGTTTRRNEAAGLSENNIYNKYSKIALSS